MKHRFVVLALALTLVPAAALADSITFFFQGTGGYGVFADATGGFHASPGLNILAVDTTTGVSMPLAGIVGIRTGPAASFSIFTSPNLVLATFNAGPADGVVILDPVTLQPILSGSTNDNAALVASYPGATGAFLAGFDVSFVSPQIMTDFNLFTVDPVGALSVTYSNNNIFDEGFPLLAGSGGGGTITIIGTPVPEPSTLGLAGCGILLCCGVLKHRVLQ